MMQQTPWSTIRGRVAVILAVPTCLLLILTGLAVADRATDWSAARQSGDRVQLALDVQDLVRELQREHGLTSGLLVGAGRYRPELAATRRLVDARRNDLIRRVDDGSAPAFEEALGSLDRLTPIRNQIDDGTIARAEGLRFYSGTIADLNDAQLAEDPSDGDQALSDGLSALQTLAAATQYLAHERGLMNGVFVNGRFEPSQYQEFAGTYAARVAAINSYEQFATDEQDAAIDRVFAT
jgi:Nitrate and nitrite sensing